MMDSKTRAENRQTGHRLIRTHLDPAGDIAFNSLSLSVPDADVIREILKGAEEFNSGKFFECHDTLEEVWRGMRGPARDFLQGLIHIAVGFYHLRNGNLIGGESQLDKGLKKLSEYGESFLGMDVPSLRGEVQGWLDKIRKGEKLQGTVADLPKYRFRV